MAEKRRRDGPPLGREREKKRQRHPRTQASAPAAAAAAPAENESLWITLRLSDTLEYSHLEVDSLANLSELAQTYLGVDEDVEVVLVNEGARVTSEEEFRAMRTNKDGWIVVDASLPAEEALTPRPPAKPVKDSTAECEDTPQPLQAQVAFNDPAHPREEELLLADYDELLRLATEKMRGQRCVVECDGAEMTPAEFQRLQRRRRPVLLSVKLSRDDPRIVGQEQIVNISPDPSFICKQGSTFLQLPPVAWAIAEFVDNAIQVPNCRQVKVMLVFGPDGKCVTIGVLNDGTGMTQAQIVDWGRVGLSIERRDPECAKMEIEKRKIGDNPSCALRQISQFGMGSKVSGFWLGTFLHAFSSSSDHVNHLMLNKIDLMSRSVDSGEDVWKAENHIIPRGSAIKNVTTDVGMLFERANRLQNQTTLLVVDGVDNEHAEVVSDDGHEGFFSESDQRCLCVKDVAEMLADTYYYYLFEPKKSMWQTCGMCSSEGVLCSLREAITVEGEVVPKGTLVVASPPLHDGKVSIRWGDREFVDSLANLDEKSGSIEMVARADLQRLKASHRRELKGVANSTEPLLQQNPILSLSIEVIPNEQCQSVNPLCHNLVLYDCYERELWARSHPLKFAFKVKTPVSSMGPVHGILFYIPSKAGKEQMPKPSPYQDLVRKKGAAPIRWGRIAGTIFLSKLINISTCKIVLDHLFTGTAAPIAKLGSSDIEPRAEDFASWVSICKEADEDYTLGEDSLSNATSEYKDVVIQSGNAAELQFLGAGSSAEERRVMHRDCLPNIELLAVDQSGNPVCHQKGMSISVDFNSKAMKNIQRSMKDGRFDLKEIPMLMDHPIVSETRHTITFTLATKGADRVEKSLAYEVTVLPSKNPHRATVTIDGVDLRMPDGHTFEATAVAGKQARLHVEHLFDEAGVKVENPVSLCIAVDSARHPECTEADVTFPRRAGSKTAVRVLYGKTVLLTGTLTSVPGDPYEWLLKAPLGEFAFICGGSITQPPVIEARDKEGNVVEDIDLQKRFTVSPSETSVLQLSTEGWTVGGIRSRIPTVTTAPGTVLKENSFVKLYLGDSSLSVPIKPGPMCRLELSCEESHVFHSFKIDSLILAAFDEHGNLADLPENALDNSTLEIADARPADPRAPAKCSISLRERVLQGRRLAFREVIVCSSQEAQEVVVTARVSGVDITAETRLQVIPANLPRSLKFVGLPASLDASSPFPAIRVVVESEDGMDIGGLSEMVTCRIKSPTVGEYRLAQQEGVPANGKEVSFVHSTGGTGHIGRASRVDIEVMYTERRSLIFSLPERFILARTVAIPVAPGPPAAVVVSGRLHVRHQSGVDPQTFAAGSIFALVDAFGNECAGLHLDVGAIGIRCSTIPSVGPSVISLGPGSGQFRVERLGLLFSNDVSEGEHRLDIRVAVGSQQITSSVPFMLYNDIQKEERAKHQQRMQDLQQAVSSKRQSLSAILGEMYKLPQFEKEIPPEVDAGVEGALRTKISSAQEACRAATLDVERLNHSRAGEPAKKNANLRITREDCGFLIDAVVAHSEVDAMLITAALGSHSTMFLVENWGRLQSLVRTQKQISPALIENAKMLAIAQGRLGSTIIVDSMAALPPIQTWLRENRLWASTITRDFHYFTDETMVLNSFTEERARNQQWRIGWEDQRRREELDRAAGRLHDAQERLQSVMREVDVARRVLQEIRAAHDELVLEQHLDSPLGKRQLPGLDGSANANEPLGKRPRLDDK
eukprot:m51a1_g14033 hypothetical protein (1738) ;mRNA; f:1152944-1161279